jgi:protein arginine kinase
MTIDELSRLGAGWLDGTGEAGDVVISSRVRLARNLADVPFSHQADDAQNASMVDLVLNAGQNSTQLSKAWFFDTGDSEMSDRQVLMERHLISPTLVKRGNHGGVLVGEDERFSVMINEEDHLRLQAVVSGFQPLSAWELINSIDDEFSKSFSYAFDDEWGYLTACPTNVGTGLRASLLMHLPGLVLVQSIEQVLRGVGQVGLAVRGYYGEGSEVVGNLFQISNQTTLGPSEMDIIENLQKVARQVMDYEKDARERMVKDAQAQLEDKIWRAYGLLQTARVISAQEFMNLASAVRLGVGMGILDSPEPALLNRLMIAVQPAHIKRFAGQPLEADDRDVWRATMVRERLGESDSSN